MSTPIKDSTVSFLSMTKTFFLKDLGTITDEQLMTKPNGKARRPIDFSYEVVGANRGILKMLKQEPPSEQPEGEKDGIWAAAPAGYTRGQLETDLTASLDAIVEYVSGLTEEQLVAPIQSWFGEVPLFSFAMFAGTHTNYHNGQLAYVAELNGDLENHWF
ncbi:MAG: hypothetical protein WCG75_00850 [Armatimonadota bacterium]